MSCRAGMYLSNSSAVAYVVYAPMAMSSPWAMLITPISPNTIARPSAISTRMVDRLRPLKACIRKVSSVIRRSPPGPGRRAGRGDQALPATRSDLGERVRLDQRRLVDHVDLAVLSEGADARMLPEVVIGLVELDLALRRIQRELGGGRDHLRHIDGARLLDRELPQIHRDVAAFHGVADHAVGAVLGLERLDELGVGRMLHALEIAHARHEAFEVLRADAGSFLLRYRHRAESLLRAGDAGGVQLLVERDVGAADHRAPDHIGLGRLDLVDFGGELDGAERVVAFAG